MARNDNGHADLNDIYDRLSHSNNTDLLYEVRRTNLLLETLLRAQGSKVPIARFAAMCNRCHYSYTFIQYEDQPKAQGPCRKCGVRDDIRLDGI